MLQWFAHLSDALFALGYVGIYIALIIEGMGLPFPGDAAMAFYGFAAAQDRFQLFAVIVLSVAGYLTGSTLSYIISAKYGADLLTRSRISFLNQRSMSRTTVLVRRYGPLLLVPGRFLPGVRGASSYVAGLLGMDFRSFLIYTLTGVTLWCTTWVLLGYWLAENLQSVMKVIQSSMGTATLMAVIIGIVYWLGQRRTLR